MKFLHIEMLLLIWAVPLLGLACYYGARKRRKVLEAFAHARTRGGLVPAGMAGRRRLKVILLLCAAALIVTALAGPQYGFRWQEVEQRGVDLIIALDVSRSMLAEDMQPTRLDRAKREIFDLLTMLQGDRVGLVAFSGTAFLQCPLTVDYQAFYLFLDVLTPDYLPVGGSDLAAAITTSIEAFDPASQAEKAVILITDGENTGSGDPLQAAEAAQKAGIKLFAIGVGAAEGVPIPAQGGGFKKDAAGQIILSRLDESLLSRMAVLSGGAYVRSVAGDMDLEAIYHNQIKAEMEAAVTQSGRKQVWADRFQWPLALAVVLLLIAHGVPPVRRLLLVWAALGLLLQAPSIGRAGPLQEGYAAFQQGDYEAALKHFVEAQLDAPDDPTLLYNLGNAYYENGDYTAAGEHYRQALAKADPALKAKLLYNLGNVAYREGQLQDAITHYEAALKADPEDIQAKENIEFVKKQMQMQQQQQNQSQNDPKNQPQDDQQQPQAQPDQPQGEQSPQEQNQSPTEQQPPPPTDPSQPDKQPPPPEPEGEEGDQEQQPQPQTAEAEAGEAQDEAQRPAAPATANMLNRLKDEPGRAMMPRYEAREVEKDW
jgi:Ca-activated chloride channel family protein